MLSKSLSTKLALLLALLLLLLLIQVVAAQDDGGVIGPSGADLVVDFDRVVPVPAEMRAAVLAALERNPSALTSFAYTVTVWEPHAGWGHLVLIPTPIYESHWELPLEDDDIVDVIVYQDQGPVWQAFLENETNRALTERIAPGQFAVPQPQAPADLAYKFPWTDGQSWRVTQGWHPTSAIDFRPTAYADPPVHGAVLAVEAGTLSSVCNDGYQAMLRVDHGPVTTEYLHLDANTLRPGDLNMVIPRGRYLGLIYDGYVFEDPHRVCVGRSGLQYSTPCGCGTGYHLHFKTSSTSIIVDDVGINYVGTNGGTYTSSNVRDGGPTTTPVAVVVNPAAISPAYAGMCDSAWYRFPGYLDQDAYLTLNTNDPDQSTNSAQWVPSLPYAGNYRIDAYIANHRAIDWQCPSKTISGDTREARYEVTHANGTVTLARDQLPLSNAWLTVGTAPFNAGSAGRVRLGDLNGEANLSRTISFSAMRFTLQPPDVPEKLTAGDGSYPDKVRLTWNSVFGAQSYDLYRATSATATKTKIGSSTSTSFEDSTAAAGTTYTYWVKAANAAGSSGFSASDTGWRPALPAGPALLSLSPASQAVFGTDAPVCVAVAVAQAVDLAAFDFTLTFPPALLQATTATLGPFLGQTGRTLTPLEPSINNTAGSVTYGAASSGSAPGATGSGSLATLCFDLLTVGDASLDFTASQLTDTQGQEQPVTLDKGSININACRPTDVDCDGDVDIIDIQQVSARWNSNSGGGLYETRYDLDGDGDIDLADIQRVAADWGWSAVAAGTGRPGAGSSAGDLTLSLSQEALPAVSTGTFDLPLLVEQADELAAFEATIHFDPSRFRVESVRFGDFITGTGRTAVPLIPVIDNQAGLLHLGTASFGAEPGGSGAGTLAWIRVTALVSAKTDFELAAAQAATAGGQPLPVRIESGPPGSLLFLPLLHK